MSIFIILPNQLFEKKYLDKKYNYIIYEHPHYFKSYNYNKKKLILHRASMKYYYDYLKTNNFNVKYVNYDEKLNINNYTLFDPIDKIKLSSKCIILESPNFLLNKNLYEEYRNKTKNFFFNSFYMWSKNKLNILPNVKSLDKENRNKLNDNIVIPKLPYNNDDENYIKLGINYVKNNFPDNCGNCDDFIYPISHKTAKKWLVNFINKKLNNFGNYQDTINENNNYLFHSVLSSCINIGLLNPIEIIIEISKHLKDITLNNIEGYIRQLFWREYQRYCYIYYDFDKDKNYFNNNGKLTNKWYDGTLGVKPVDDCIINGFNSGYLHHIERLMIVGNYMNLSGISPKEGFKWFMEFSCDSYEWVMKQNVLHMVFFNGHTMRRPYICSSNYILKMSNYKKDVWCDIINEKYHNFLTKNKKKLLKYKYFFPSL